MKVFKKGALVLVAGVALVGTIASAYVQYPDGGVWVFGEKQGGGAAISNYYHGSKWHSSSLVSRWDGDSDYGDAYARETSYAEIETRWSEQVAFYYNYE